jgi:hypothetical protein
MKSILLSLVLVLGLAPQAMAQVTCSQRLRMVVTGDREALTVTKGSYRTAAKALAHYRSRFGSEGVYIESVNRYKRANLIVGYKISITDGGDESKVDYILDHRSVLISAYWHNQSPERLWFCEDSGL